MPDDQQLVTVTIDGVSVAVPKGTLLVEAAKQVKQEIPVYCYHTKLGPAGLCRICLVEIEGMPKLQIACNTQVTDGMVVHTQNDRVDTGRATVLELFLVNHPLDCPICDKGGECDLQDYAMAYGRGNSDLIDPKVPKPKAVDLGPTIVLDEERCVVCQRCVRFDDIIAREQQLVVKDRGHKDIIATASGQPYKHYFTGNVTELCPVGALTSKTYRFKSRPWDLNRTKTSCTQCALGCQQYVDVRFGDVLRTMSVEEDDAISDGWLCDRGRYNFGFYGSNERVTQPLYKRDGEFVQISWEDAFALWAGAIRDAIAKDGTASIGVLGGGRLLNEEAYLVQHVFRGVGVENIDWRTGTQRQAASNLNEGPLSELDREKHDAIVVLGGSPGELAPVFDLRIKKAALRHGTAVVRANDMASVRSGVPDSAQKIAIVWDGVDTQLAADVANAFATRTITTYIIGEQSNSRGAEAMGLRSGLAVEEMLQAALDGTMDVLTLFSANPVRNHPAKDLVRTALEKVPFLVVSELFMTETAQLATLVLPAKGAFEKNGTTLNFASDILPVNQPLQAPESALSDGEMLIGLGERLGVPLPTQEELEEHVIRQAAKRPEHVFGDAAFAIKHGNAIEEAMRERGYTERRLFDGGGTVAHDEAMAVCSN